MKLIEFNEKEEWMIVEEPDDSFNPDFRIEANAILTEKFGKNKVDIADFEVFDKKTHQYIVYWE